MILDDFFTRALFAGIGLACVAGPLGATMVWQRMVHFSDALSHAALLGIGISVAYNQPEMIGVLVVASCISMGIIKMQHKVSDVNDVVIGFISQTTLALGLLLNSFIYPKRLDLNIYLFGDILSLGKEDFYHMVIMLIVCLVTLLCLWKRIIILIMQSDFLHIEKKSVLLTRFLYMGLLVFFVALSVKIMGILLIASLLVIPSLAARLISKSPESMACFASFFGILSIVIGLYVSLYTDSLSGPTIGVVASCLCVLTYVTQKLFLLVKKDFKKFTNVT